MFSHFTLGSNDIPKSKAFYDAIVGVTGGEPARMDAKGRLIYIHDGGLLIVTNPVNGEAATFANGVTVGFRMTSDEQVHAWHDAGVAAGGTTAEDPPGPRAPGLYLAYLRDPDGNKLCAMHRPT